MIDWDSIQMTKQQKDKHMYMYQYALAERLENLEKMAGRYRAEYKGKTGFMKAKKEIVYEQFLDNLDYMTLTGQEFKKTPKLKLLYEREKQYHEKKYPVKEYPE